MRFRRDQHSGASPEIRNTVNSVHAVQGKPAAAAKCDGVSRFLDVSIRNIRDPAVCLSVNTL